MPSALLRQSFASSPGDLPIMPSEIAAFGETASHLANHPFVFIGLALLLFFGVLRALIGSGILRRVDRKMSGVIIQSLLGYALGLRGNLSWGRPVVPRRL